MSLSRNVFGDFSVAFRSPLPVPVAAGRLAAVSDQSTFRQSTPGLHGYAIASEVLVWEGHEFLVNPFRPYFRGSFSEEHGATVLSGVFHSDWRVKVWCALAAIASPIAFFSGLAGGLAHNPLHYFAAPAIAAAALFCLRRSIRPGSRLVRSLSKKIEMAVAGEGG